VAFACVLILVLFTGVLQHWVDCHCVFVMSLIVLYILPRIQFVILLFTILLFFANIYWYMIIFHHRYNSFMSYHCTVGFFLCSIRIRRLSCVYDNHIKNWLPPVPKSATFCSIFPQFSVENVWTSVEKSGNEWH